MNESLNKNLAFIDGQNLYMNTTKRDIDSWKIDLSRFRVYLKNKYLVYDAYYFLGNKQESNKDLYSVIKQSGYILVFREHDTKMIGRKKGNVDSDIIFHVMKKLYKKENFHKIIIVSGDGDYKLLIDFLIEENKFEKILFPDNRYASSLYQKLGSEHFDYLDKPEIKNKIQFQQKSKF